MCFQVSRIQFSLYTSPAKTVVSVKDLVETRSVGTGKDVQGVTTFFILHCRRQEVESRECVFTSHEYSIHATPLPLGRWCPLEIW